MSLDRDKLKSEKPAVLDPRTNNTPLHLGQGEGGSDSWFLPSSMV